MFNIIRKIINFFRLLKIIYKKIKEKKIFGLKINEIVEKNSEYSVITNVDDIPKHILSDFHSFSLDWIFEYTYKYQPRTSRILKRAKNYHY